MQTISAVQAARLQQEAKRNHNQRGRWDAAWWSAPKVRCRGRRLVPTGQSSSQREAVPAHEERWEAAGKYDGIVWHTFRHTYRSWLDDTGPPVGVQQKLMRHAQISTTMNVYGNALMEAKREANTKVVRKALRST